MMLFVRVYSHRHAKTQADADVCVCVYKQTGRGAGKQSLSAVWFDPEPKARQGSGVRLSGHWA